MGHKVVTGPKVRKTSRTPLCSQNNDEIRLFKSSHGVIVRLIKRQARQKPIIKTTEIQAFKRPEFIFSFIVIKKDCFLKTKAFPLWFNLCQSNTSEERRGKKITDLQSIAVRFYFHFLLHAFARNSSVNILSMLKLFVFKIHLRDQHGQEHCK